MIIFYILTTLSLDNVWTLLGENCCWSLLGLKGLKQGNKIVYFFTKMQSVKLKIKEDFITPLAWSFVSSFCSNFYYGSVSTLVQILLFFESRVELNQKHLNSEFASF